MAESNANDGSSHEGNPIVFSVMNSSTKRRVHELHSLAERIKRGDLPQEEFSLVIQLLFKTHPYYHDRSSRDAVRRCFLQMFESEALSGACIRYLVVATMTESQKGGIAPSSAFVLLEWASVTITQISKSLELFNFHIKGLLVAQVSLLELCIGSPHAKGSLKKSALTVTRRGLRAAFSTKNEYEAIIKAMVEDLTAKDSVSTQKNALLLGAISGVCAKVPKLKEVLEGLKKGIYEFYTRELIMSRTPIPRYISESLHDFFLEFTTPEDFNAELVPALDKALLRSPEVVLNGLITSLFKSLSPTIDISKALANKLLKPLLSSIKSSNANIRNGAILAFTAGIGKSLEGDEQAIGKITDELVNPVKTGKVTAVDQRALYATMIETLSLSDRTGGNFSTNLAEIIIKEQNEVVLLKLSSAFFNSLARELKKNIEPAKGVVGAINKGLADKRQNFRRTWILRIGDWIWNMGEKPNTVTIKFCENITQKIADSWTEVVTNPLPAAQTGIVTVGYVFTALALDKMAKWDNEKIALIIKKADIVKHCLATTPKPSFLLNHKVYSKLTQADDQKWAIRALAATADRVEYEANHADTWALAFLYLLCAHNSPLEIRNQAVSALSSAYLHRPEAIGKVVLNGVWQWLRKIEYHEKENAPSAAKTGGTYIGLAIHAICLSVNTAGGGLETRTVLEEDMVKNQLVNLAVVTHHELMPGVDWIRLCQKTGVDPGELASEKAARLIGEIRIYTGLSGRSSYIRGAALKSSATLAFVAPAAITPLIVQLFTDDLNPALLKGIGPQEAAIWKAPPGVAYVDVLSKPNICARQEKSKDADTLKWEAELRAQLAQKKGAGRKLTADEKTRVEEQVAKETIIRKNVEEVNLKLSRGIGIIRCLAEGPPTAVEMWMGAAVSAVIKVMEAGAGLVIGDSGVKAYLASAEHVSTRLGALRPFVGIASLRALKVRELSPEVQEEPLGALATRLLYRLRFTGEQRPFDTVSLVYLLSFVSLILEKGGIGTAEASEEADEQIVLAIEFLSFHTESCVDPNVPRGSILNLLINSMQRYTAHYKPIKDCLLDLCRCITSSISLDEIKILVGGVISPEVNVRTATLQAIDAEIDLTDFDFSEELWLACHDELDENVELAKSIWEENVLEVHEDSARKIIPFLEYMDKSLRAAAARGLAEAVRRFPDVFSNILDTLQDLYSEKAKPILPAYDEFGMLKKVDNRDPWESRSGLALAFKELAPIFISARLAEFCAFLIEEGPLGDRNHTVREEMIEAATAIIAAQGAAHVEELMKVFEQSLEGPDDGSELRDRINEAVIILYGALGRHLGSGDKRIPGVVDRLLATLSTPSETVQYAVAECLPPLIKASRDKAPDYIKKLLDRLFTAKAYAARRGAAYGLAGVIKGRGISALKDYRVMSTLRGAVENKKEPNARQGAIFAYELLSLILGRLFEPYVIQILPLLLQSFGDSVIGVREACSDAAKVCFSSLSSYGVKVILPDLLEGLDEPAWRSKKGACETLGAMAYLAPHQLAISLPEIIPPLTTVLNDSHKEVRTAANRSLKKFGEVISNPEVKDVVDALLKALSDPTKYTDDALDVLMKVSFVHYLDAPSLALIVRILERGLGDRSATKRKASQIIGSLAHLTERKDVMVHIPILVSGLKQAIVDPVPATRATASKALGSLVEKLGEDALPDIIPGLMSTLKSDTGAGDRLGSAQALSEVLSGLGTQRLEETLPTILQNANSSKPSVREGFMSLFIFLPACFGNSFSAYLSKIIPPILSGLADDIESIRETSLRAGRLLVKNFATRAIDLLLPELERGLADNNHRIRLSSVELVGDLLFNLTGISGKAEQDDLEATREIGSSLLEVLGKEKRDKVLSALYICRCDTSGQVRLAAVAVWKALVASPRTLKELVPTLTQLIIRRLASSSAEQKVIAGQALGELIRKAGEGVLSTLLPTLEEGLRFATDTDAKQGICIALKEVVNSTSPESLEDYESTLVSVVRTALVDADDNVREAAAEAFDALQKLIGKKIVDQVLPHLLSLLRSENDAEHALAALLTLLTEQTRSNIILPILIPTLLAPPISHFNARALASLAEVAGSSLNRRLPNIMNSLMDNIIACQNEELLVDLNTSFDSVLLSVDEYDGLNTAMNEMLKLVKHDDHRKRAAACGHFAKFFAETDVDYSKYTQDCVRVLLISFDDRDKQVVKNAWNALNELTRKLKKEEMEALVFSTRQVLQQVGVPGAELLGFSLPKGINAILPIFLQGLMYGTPDQRTQSALAISDIIDRTNSESLRPFVTQITGPLIRVVSERSVDVKAAILLTLNSLLQKIPTYLKPFLPQLQRTFAKSLADTSSELLRTRAAKALGTLITLTPRIDPLISELVTGAKTPDPGVKDAMMKALYEVVSKAGGNMGEPSKASILSLIEDDLDQDDDRMAIAGARLLGVLVPHLSPDDSSRVIRTHAVSNAFTKASVLSLNAVLVESSASLTESPFFEETPSIISQGISHKNPFISDNCVLAAGKFLISSNLSKSFETAKSILESLTQAIKSPVSASTDTKRLALVVIRTVSRLQPEIIRPHLPLLAPVIFSSVRDIVIPVKLSAEQAFIAIFQVVQQGDAVFEKYISTMEGVQKRSMHDYFRRIAVKLAAAEKERNEAGGAGLGLNSDEEEDIKEIMSVGRADSEGWVSND